MKALTTLLLLTLVSSCQTKYEKIDVEVMRHNTSSSQYGNIYYHTILKAKDGSLYNAEGMNYYLMPIGSKTKYTTIK